MKNLLDFFLNINKLKTQKRRGWVWLGVKNPESIAEHSFRTAFAAWLLGVQARLPVGQLIQTALAHDICEVYAGDLTPYYGILPKNTKQRKEVLKRWVRLPQAQKKFFARKKFLLEKKAILKITRNLRPELKKEIFSLWLNFENGHTQVGRFVKQVDKLEAMLQAIEYFGTGSNTPVTGWWEEAEEVIEHPVLLTFLETIHNSFYKKQKGEFKEVLDFIILLGRLKQIPRSGWVIRKVKNPESIADHGFMLSLMAWMLAKHRNTPVHIAKILILSLANTLPSLFIGEKTPYDTFLTHVRSEKKRQEILRQWIRQPLTERKRIFQKNCLIEKSAVLKAVKNLSPMLQTLLIKAWEEVKQNKTREAQFVNQVYVLEALLQALLYWRQNKRFPIKPWWEWAFESSHSQMNLDFIDELKKRFV